MVASRRLPYIYIQNWKCGCSTVKSSLWAAEHALGLTVPPDYPHRKIEGGPFAPDPKRWEHPEREFVFTVVRNPYVRVLSAYLDQIARHRNAEAWGQFALQHGLDEGPLSFNEFLTLLARSPHGAMNPHWRPQYASVAPKLVPYDFIGAVETFDHDMQHVLERIFGQGPALQSYAPHHTGSSKKLATHYGPKEIALVQEIYEEDFASLGYSMDPERQERVATTPRPDPTMIRTWGKASRLVDERQFPAAIAELENLRAVLSGPTVDDRLLRCYQAVALSGTKLASARGIDLIERDTSLAQADADLWKCYSQTLRALGRREDSLAAQIHAAEMRHPSPERDTRLRRLQWRLALLRASKGRRRDALATVQLQASLPHPANHSLGGGWTRRAQHRGDRRRRPGGGALASRPRIARHRTRTWRQGPTDLTRQQEQVAMADPQTRRAGDNPLPSPLRPGGECIRPFGRHRDRGGLVADQ